LAVIGGFNDAARAASFDCAKAASPREKLVCSDPDLSDLDTKLGRLYAERRALLSPHGSDLLQRSELNWLKFIATVCPLDAPAEADSRRVPKNCLAQRYQERLDHLAKAAQKIGPYVFNRIDLYTAAPAPSGDSSGGTPGFFVKHVGYPQIDNVDTAAVTAWNARAERKLRTGGSGCDDEEDYAIGYASENLISASWSGGQYCHGTPHGTGWSKSENLILQPTLRKLRESDVFGDGNAWRPKLQALFWAALEKQGWASPENPQDDVKSAILKIVVSPDRWVFTTGGLEVVFNSYEGGCYACTPAPVIIAWSDLKPLLAANAVVP
jgi:uncharacterized protein